MQSDGILKSIHELLRTQLFTIGGTPVNLATLTVFFIILAASFLISRLLQKALSRTLDARGVQDAGTISASTRLLHYIIMVIGTGVAVHTLGVNLTALFAAGAVFAVALGFAMQTILQNFVSGVILLTERTIKPGDVLEVEGRMVRVTRMGTRTTVARTLDDEDLIIPNSLIAQATVKNYTLRDSDYRLRTTVGVVYGSDMALVRKTLEETTRQLTWRSKKKAPVVLLMEFGSSSVDWEVSVWVEDPWGIRRTRSMLNEAIWWALKDAGITIAFPQVDVHFDPPVVESLRELRRAG